MRMHTYTHTHTYIYIYNYMHNMHTHKVIYIIIQYIHAPFIGRVTWLPIRPGFLGAICQQIKRSWASRASAKAADVGP